MRSSAGQNAITVVLASPFALLLFFLSCVAGQVTPTSVQLGTTTSAYTTECGKYTYFSVVMHDPCKDLTITATPSAGEPKIFVSKTQQNPTSSSKSWAAWALGVYTVTVSHWQPESSPGKYYIGVYADCSKQSSAAAYTLSTSAVTTDDGTDIYLHSGFSTSVSVPAGGYKDFHFCMPAQTSATSGVTFIGGTLGISSTKLIVAKVLDGTLAAGMAISGVGINSPCHIVSCVSWSGGAKGAQSFANPSTFDNDDFLECTMDSTQNIPGPLSYSIPANVATTLTNTISFSLSSTTSAPCYPHAATGCSTPSTNVPSAGFTVVSEVGFQPAWRRNSTFILQSATKTVTTTVANNIVTSTDSWSGAFGLYNTASLTALKTGVMGLAITGFKDTSSGTPSFSQPSQFAAMRGKTADSSVFGDACGDVVVSWKMTTSDNLAKYPDVLLSRTATSPKVEGYVWRRTDYNSYGTYTIGYNQLTARDSNGYLSGSWFLSLYGYCAYSTAQDRSKSKLHTNADDDAYSGSGKCRTNDAPVTVTVSVSFVPRGVGLCTSAANNVPGNAPPSYTVLTSGVTVTDSVLTTPRIRTKGNFYMIANPSPCNSMSVYVETISAKLIGVTTTSTDFKTFAAETAIAKWPDVEPVLADKGWSGYSSFNQNYTIDAWDPAFDGGSTCGSDKKQPCYYFINLFPFDPYDLYDSITYSITVTLKPQKRIFGTPQLNQVVGANAVNSYKFCVNPSTTPDKSAQVQLFEYTDACQCPDTYSDLEMVVSSSLPGAGIDDNVWRVGYGNKPSSGVSTINLLASDTDTRVGTYYLNVIGHCTASSDCHNECKCAPCTNLPNSPYAVSVSNYGTSISNPQASCTNYESYSPYGQAQCCYNTPSKISQLTKELGRATMTANAAISMVTLTWVFCCGVGLYYAYRYVRGAWVPLPLSSAAANDWKDADMEMAPKSVESRLSGHGSAHGSSHGSAHGRL